MSAPRKLHLCTSFALGSRTETTAVDAMIDAAWRQQLCTRLIPKSPTTEISQAGKTSNRQLVAASKSIRANE